MKNEVEKNQFATRFYSKWTAAQMWMILSVLALVCGFAVSPANAQTPIDTGYRDFSYGTTGSSTPTGEKPESKLWWNDGFWWGNLYNDALTAYHIYKFDVATQSWTDTGVETDNRNSTKGDALWDTTAQKLYIVSHPFSTNGQPGVLVGDTGKLFRYSYNGVTKTYSLDAGFPVDVNHTKIETLTIARDSAGVLWLTWVEGPDNTIEDSVVMVTHSLGNDLTWATPYVLPVGAATAAVATDDISSIISFGGNKIGIMWSNQVTGKFYFAVHNDGDSDVTWQAVETAFPASGVVASSDDHLNLHADSTGRVFVAAKTSASVSTDMLDMVLVRETNGTWSSHQFGTVGDHYTRGILLLDEENQQLYMFATNPEAGGAIYYKVTDMNNINFPAGQGTAFIKSTDITELTINNVASMKQNLNSLTGLLAIASDQNSHFYYHNYLTIQPLRPTITSFTPGSGPVGTSVALTGRGFTDASEVAFNGTAASFLVRDSGTGIDATVPAGATTGRISVTTPNGTGTSASNFVVIVPPNVTSFSPESGPVGTLVTINGTGFIGTNAVTINGTSATNLIVVSDIKITVNVASGTTTGKITVTNPAGFAESATDFTVILPPNITSFSPTSGPVGTLVTITGSGFIGTTSVKFLTKEAIFTVVNDTTIQATVPTGAKSGKIMVKNAAGTANTGRVKFTVTK